VTSAFQPPPSMVSIFQGPRAVGVGEAHNFAPPTTDFGRGGDRFRVAPEGSQKKPNSIGNYDIMLVTMVYNITYYN
jgi:hypothetical protein